MIHTAQKDPKEIFKFAKKFRKSYKHIPLVAVPSSYSQIKETQLIKNGFNIVIYANQMFKINLSCNDEDSIINFKE